jgi:hypothetical protein
MRVRVHSVCACFEVLKGQCVTVCFADSILFNKK